MFASASTGFSSATEYFVAPDGDDTRDGLSHVAAFGTVQKGVDALAPGDTLTILPGEYAEGVKRANLGSESAETLIRAAIPGTVVLLGDEPAGPFKKTEGFQFVYEVPFDRDVQAVNELDTLTGLFQMPNLVELEAAPGHWMYDADSKTLYISTSDQQPPENHVYRASILASDGIFLESPERVTIDGLAFAGFDANAKAASEMSYRSPNAGMGVIWGLLIHKGKGCVIRNCTAYLNGGGIAIHTGTSPDAETAAGFNLVEDCVAYGNFSQRNTYESSGVGIYTPNSDEIRDCYTYRNNAFGARMYGPAAALSKIVGTTSWGNYGSLGDLQLKVSSTPARTENCISLGGFTNIEESRSSITGKTTQSFSADNISLLGEDGEGLDLDHEFADAVNFDFRLQADSKFRVAGPGGTDRGPHPYQANIYYVSASGDDAADGLSMRGAWKTLAHATGKLRAGDTLYLEPGEYREDLDLEVLGSQDEPVSIRGRGEKAPTISGKLSIRNSSNLEFQRIHFNGPVDAESSEKLVFNQCGFSSSAYGLKAVNVRGLRLTHCQFAGFSEAGLSLAPEVQAESFLQKIKRLFVRSSVPAEGAPSADLFLTGNLFDNTNGPAVILDRAADVLHSNYNSYRDLTRSWRVDGEWVSPADLSLPHDRQSRELVPEWSKEDGTRLLANPVAFLAGGPLGKPVGLYSDLVGRKQMRISSGPKVHSVSATTANLEWTTSLPARCEIAWGDTPECNNTASFDVNYFGSFSLIGLEPGTQYFFRIKSASLPPELTAKMDADPIELNGDVVSFETLSENAMPVTYFVSPEGSDGNLGNSRQAAWRTLVHAASKVNVGDTVLVGAGTYPERVRIRATGDTGSPITFKAHPGEKVVMSGAGLVLNNAFVATGKSFLNFDGFYFEEFNLEDSQGWNPAQSGEFKLYLGRDISITRCLSDGRGGYTAPFVTAWEITKLLIKNCVFVNKFQGASLWRPCPDLRIVNNVFAGTMVYHLVLGNTPPDKTMLMNNIFTDNIPSKAFQNVPLFNLGEDTVNRNNCYYLRDRFSPETRTPYDMGGKTFSRLQEKGIILDPLFANPRFAGVVTPDARFNPSYDMGYALEDSPDRLMDAALDLSFADFFATNPEVLERGIGLIPADFESLLPATGSDTPPAPDGVN